MSHQLILQDVQIALSGNSLVDISAQINSGEIFTVMGPSGSGKSTLLAYIAGFIDPVFNCSGEVKVDGDTVTDLAAEDRHIGLLFQDPLLFPHLSVAGNLRFGIPRKTTDKDGLVRQSLAKIGLSGFENRDPATLSGGQKSRVALLRLLLSQPRAVLLDEPFANLDRQLRQELRAAIFAELRSAGLPVILVSHDNEDAEAAGGRIFYL